MKNKAMAVLMIMGIIASSAVLPAAAADSIIFEDDFDYNYLDENWQTEAASNCYVTIGENAGETGNALLIFDNNDNTSSPYYEGYSKAYRVFSPQRDKISVEFHFNSNKIPIGHEVISLNMGGTNAFEMKLNNHGQNSHIQLNENGRCHMINNITANRWHKVKINIDVKNGTADFYLDNMEDSKLHLGLTNKVEYIDRITFSTGKELGEKSTLKIDNLKIYGTAVKATEVVCDTAELNMSVGGYAKLNAYINPIEATDKTVYYSSSNADVATVNSKGELYAISAGNAEIAMTSADGAKTVCRVFVVRDNKELELNSDYDYANKTIQINGKSPYAEKAMSLLIKDKAEKVVYIGELSGDKNGNFDTTIPYTSDTDNSLNIEVKTGTLTKTAELSYSVPKKQSSIQLDKELYVTSVNEYQKIERFIETTADEIPTAKYSSSNKTTYLTGAYNGNPNYIYTQVNGPNDAYIVGNTEGDAKLTVSTVEAVPVSASALVQVNAKGAEITDEELDGYRKISVSLDEDILSEKIKKGADTRFAAGYAAFIPQKGELASAKTSFALSKYHIPGEIPGVGKALAKYEISACDALEFTKGKLQLPLDYLKSQIKDYNCIRVYLSKDGEIWENGKACYDSTLACMIVDSTILPKYVALAEITTPFTDIKGHFAESAIRAYYSRGILDGNANFRPNDYITLDELVALTNKTYATGEYAEKSNKPVTREKAAKVICDLMKYNAVNSEKVTEGIKGFKDFADIDSQYLTSMGMLYNSKVIQGDDAKALRPKGYITRAEAVVIMQRLQ